jgi:pentatricopeptide repeat protein
MSVSLFGSIQISKWMLGKGQGRTLNTYSGLLKAFSEEGRIDEAQELYNKILMQNTKHTPLRIFRQMLTMYRRYQMYEEIIDVSPALFI